MWSSTTRHGPCMKAETLWSSFSASVGTNFLPLFHHQRFFINMSVPIRYALPQRPATVAVLGIAAWYFGRENPNFANVFGGTANLDKWFFLIAKVHAAEAAAMLVYSLYRGADLITSIKYTLTQFVVGFPTYFQFKKLNN